jgi:hypothetical protein
MPNILMRYPGGRGRALTLSYDDGAIYDIRLMEIMQKYGLKGTFNINSGLFSTPEKMTRAMTKEQCVEEYRKAGMEVAVHGEMHTHWAHVPQGMCVRDIIRDREQLEEAFGTIIRGAAYPFGSCSDATVEALRAAGIVYCRTTVSTESFSLPTDWLRLPATCHHKNPRLMELAKRFVEEERSRPPQLFYLWGHSYEFNNDQNWNVIEEFAEYVGNWEDIWYATNIEIYDYVDAYRRLRFSSDGRIVYNPSITEVFFMVGLGGKIYSVKPGETLTLA